MALVRKTLMDLRWQVLWYGLGLGLYAAGVVFLFPAFEEALQEVEYPEEFLEFFGGAGADLSDPAVFISLEYFALTPLVLMVFALFASTGALAGEEGKGTLETLLSQPVSRTRLFVAKSVAILLAALAIVALICVGWVLSVPLVDLHGMVGVGDAVGAQVLTLPVTVFFAGWGLFLGAIAPSRGSAAGVLGVAVIASYLLGSLAQAVAAIEWMRYLSPYWYSGASELLTESVVWWHQALLLAGGLIGGGLGLLAFQGREIGAGHWQPAAWRRALPGARERSAVGARA